MLYFFDFGLLKIVSCNSGFSGSRITDEKNGFEAADMAIE